jgi:hypothetical protein
MPACGAKARSGHPCKRAGMLNGRCKFHGGATPSGPASPHWKHGKYGKYMPKRLAERAEEMLNDTSLTTLEHELSILDVRLAGLLETLGTSGNGDVLKRIDQKLRQFKAAAGKPNGEKADVEAARLALTELEQLVADGLTESATWSELYLVLEAKRKTVETQGKVNKDQQYFLAVVEVIAMVNLLSDEVMRYVTDRAARAAVSQIFARFSGGSDRPALST